MDVPTIEASNRIAADVTGPKEPARPKMRNLPSVQRRAPQAASDECMERENRTGRPDVADEGELLNGAGQQPAMKCHEDNGPICRTEPETQLKERSEAIGRAIRGDDQPNEKSLAARRSRARLNDGLGRL